jgi:pimeloyl-ACP methyl ester carboxylesterase
VGAVGGAGRGGGARRTRELTTGVATAVTMPRLGLSMVEGTVVEWRARPGRTVAKGEVILEIESEKAEVEVEATAGGVLAAVYVEPGTTVPVGALLGAIAAPDEAFDANAFAAAFVPEVPGAPATAGARGSAGTPATSRAGAAAISRPGPAPSGAKVAPAARALARKLGVDPETVPGTGPGGRVTVEDVERATATTGPVAEIGGGVRLAYESIGTGSPLLLVAGYGVDATGWRPQVDTLRDAFTVTAYDHRGIGASSPLGAPITIADLAADAAGLLARLDHAPALVAGASMGAAVALELALAHPARVRGLVLLTPVLEADPRLAAVLRTWREHDAPTAESRVRAMLPWLLGREHLAHAGRREATAAAWRAMAARTPAATLRHHADALLAWLGTRTADLGRIRVPALVIAGGDDALVPLAGAEALARGLPHARLEVLPGAGHALGVERAADVARLVRAFAAEI